MELLLEFIILHCVIGLIATRKLRRNVSAN